MTPAYERAAGIAEITSFEIVVCRLTLCVSTIGVSPVTVIVSASVPTFMSALIDAVNEPVSSTPSRLTRGEPGQRERHVSRCPARRSTMRYWPAAVGDGRPNFLDQRRARRFDGHARQHGAGRVLDDAGDGRLGVRRCREYHQTGESRAATLSTRAYTLLCSFRTRTSAELPCDRASLLHYRDVGILGSGSTSGQCEYRADLTTFDVNRPAIRKLE